MIGLENVVRLMIKEVRTIMTEQRGGGESRKFLPSMVGWEPHWSHQ